MNDTVTLSRSQAQALLRRLEKEAWMLDHLPELRDAYQALQSGLEQPAKPIHFGFREHGTLSLRTWTLGSHIEDISRGTQTDNALGLLELAIRTPGRSVDLSPFGAFSGDPETDDQRVAGLSVQVSRACTSVAEHAPDLAAQLRRVVISRKDRTATYRPRRGDPEIEIITK